MFILDVKRTIEFGFSFDFQQPIATKIQQVQLAESSGFDFVLVPDCIPYPNSYDSFVLQAHLATNTNRIQIGVGVVNRCPKLIPYSKKP